MYYRKEWRDVCVIIHTKLFWLLFTAGKVRRARYEPWPRDTAVSSEHSISKPLEEKEESFFFFSNGVFVRMFMCTCKIIRRLHFLSTDVALITSFPPDLCRHFVTTATAQETHPTKQQRLASRRFLEGQVVKIIGTPWYRISVAAERCTPPPAHNFPLN